MERLSTTDNQVLCAPKVGAEVVHDFVEPAYNSFVPKQQCGATKGRGTDLATHVLRLLQDFAIMHNMSIALFFDDIVDRIFDPA